MSIAAVDRSVKNMYLVEDIGFLLFVMFPSKPCCGYRSVNQRQGLSSLAHSPVMSEIEISNRQKSTLLEHILSCLCSETRTS